VNLLHSMWFETLWICIAELSIVCVNCFSRSRKLLMEFLHLSENKMSILQYQIHLKSTIFCIRNHCIVYQIQKTAKSNYICKVTISQIIHDYTSQLCFLSTLWMVTLCFKWCPLLSFKLVIRYQNVQYKCLLSGEGFKKWHCGLVGSVQPQFHLLNIFLSGLLLKMLDLHTVGCTRAPKTLPYGVAYWQNGLKSSKGNLSSHFT